MIKRIRCLETNPFKGIDAHLRAINCRFMEVLREEFFSPCHEYFEVSMYIFQIFVFYENVIKGLSTILKASHALIIQIPVGNGKF